MRPSRLTFLLAGIALAACAGFRPAALSPEDMDAISSLRGALIEAIEAGDANAYADLCTSDVRILHTGSPIITGRADFIHHNAAIFEAVTVTKLELTPVQIYGADDVAYEIGTQALSIEPAMPGFGSDRKYVHVMRRGADGRWRFAALMSNDS